MTSRRNPMQEKARRARYGFALERNELRAASDGCHRIASTGATSAMVKQNDPQTQRLIDEELERRRRAPNTVLGAG